MHHFVDDTNLLYSSESLNPIQNGEGQKGPSASFFPVTSTNVTLVLIAGFNPS